MTRLLGSIKTGGPRHGNILRQVFDPGDMRPHIGNWDEVAGDLIRHLHEACARNPVDHALHALLDEVLAFPEVPSGWRRREARAPLPVITTVFIGPTGPLSFFSTLTGFGTSWDITAEETRIECMHPVDEAARAYCRALAERDS